MTAPTYQLTHLAALEAESLHIFREVAAEFERRVLLFSGGKDSAVMLWLAIGSRSGTKAGVGPVGSGWGLPRGVGWRAMLPGRVERSTNAGGRPDASLVLDALHRSGGVHRG